MRRTVLLALSLLSCKTVASEPSRTESKPLVVPTRTPQIVEGGYALGAVRWKKDGVSFAAGATPVKMSFRAAGRGEVRPMAEVEPRLREGRVEYRRSSSITEWWIEGPFGLEVGLDVESRPAGEGPLLFDLAVDAPSFAPIVEKDRVRLVDPMGRQTVFVRELVVTDAAGRVLPARFAETKGAVRIEIRDEGATYPLRVDPIVGVETKLVSPIPGLYNHFGSPALSKGRLIVGENEADPSGKGNAGLAYVYAPTTLSLEATLAPSDAEAEDRFGTVVAFDADTALITSSTKNSYQGAAYVFVRGSTGWTQQAKLVAADGAPNDSFGSSAALAGNTAVIGANLATVSGTANAGAAYVFTRTGTTWSSGTKLTSPTPGFFGSAVAVSANTIAVSNPGEGGSQGNIYVYTGSGSAWTLQQKLGIAASTTPYFGQAVALDGDTLVGSAIHETVGTVSEAGSVYVFTRTASTWSQQARLTAAGPKSYVQFGWSVALSGNTVAVGASEGGASAQGSVTVFQRTGTAWAQKTELVGVHDHSLFGWRVALDGDLAAIGAAGEDAPGKTGAGAVHVYTPLLAYANGATCTVNGACASGYCVDGVCCNAACTESCKACNLTGKVGTCSAVDGSPVGTRSCTPSKFCKAGACSSECTAESDCVTGYYCDLTASPGTCKAKGAATCKADKECTSGFCVDGQCCDRACGGQCEACDVAGKEGTCSPVSGAPHGTRPKCADDPAKPCEAKACDGAKDPASCTVLKNVGVQCAAATCSGADLVGAANCDDKGACVAPEPSKCGKYTCDPAGPACRTTCTAPTDCAKGFTCLSGVCSEGARCSDDRASSIAKSGEVLPCAPFLCGADGNCSTTCKSSSDCAPSAVCNVDKQQCVPSEPTTDDSGGCAFGSPAKTTTAPALLLLALGLLARRRPR